MNHKILSIVSAAALTTATLFSAAAFAGDGQYGGRPSPEERLARMQQHLQLRDDQVTQIRSIRESGGTREDIFNVLNETQQAQLREHRARKGRHGGGGRPPRDESGEDQI